MNQQAEAGPALLPDGPASRTHRRHHWYLAPGRSATIVVWIIERRPRTMWRPSSACTPRAGGVIIVAPSWIRRVRLYGNVPIFVQADATMRVTLSVERREWTVSRVRRGRLGSAARTGSAWSRPRR